METQKPFHIKSPLILSHELSLLNSDNENKSNINVYLKLDNIQPSGSFKIRGFLTYIILCQKNYKNK